VTSVVVVEQVGGSLTEASIDALAVGAGLGSVVAVSSSLLSDASLAAIGHWTPLALHAQIADTAVFAATVAVVLVEHDAHTLVCAPNAASREIAGRVAVRLSLPIVSAVSSATLDGAGLVLHTVADGGQRGAVVRVPAGRAVLMVQPASVTRDAAAASSTDAGVEPGNLPTVITRIRAVAVDSWAPHSEAPLAPLDSARIVLAGGRGLGSAERLHALESFARSRGAAFGSSRAPVEAGWTSYNTLVGQTGATIAPDVYVAFGISGAPQHLAGFRSAKLIVAINNDPTAPIFDEADVVIVADAREVVDRLANQILTSASSAATQASIAHLTRAE